MTYEEMSNFDEKSSFLDQKGLKIGYLIFLFIFEIFQFSRLCKWLPIYGCLRSYRNNVRIDQQSFFKQTFEFLRPYIGIESVLFKSLI